MTDKMDHDELDEKDRELDRRLLEILDEPVILDERVPVRGPRLAGVDREVREMVEALGLLAYGAEPMTPPASLKGKVLAAVAAESLEEEGSTPERKASPVAPIDGHPAFGGGRRELDERQGGGRLRSFLVAAVVAFMMLGVSGWFHLQLRQQQNVVSQLQEQLRSTNLRLEEVSDSRRDVMSALRGMSLLAPGPVEVCPLRPVGDEPVQPRAHGSLVLARENGRWYIRVRNLEPARGDEIYTLWFLNEDQALKKVNLGRGERALEVNASGVPAGMTAAAVTLEPSPETLEPTGPRVLYGHSREMDRL